MTTKEDLIASLNADLTNEYKHWHFYMLSAAKVTGLHREEIKEFLLKQAASEMTHISQFSDLIVGLGGQPSCMPADFPTYFHLPDSILSYALEMEEEVIKNYFERMKQAEELDSPDGRWVVIFLEDQMADSRADADHIRQMLR